MLRMQILGTAGDLHALHAIFPVIAHAAEQQAGLGALGQLVQQLGQLGLAACGMDQGRMGGEAGLAARRMQGRQARLQAVVGGRYIQQHHRERGS